MLIPSCVDKVDFLMRALDSLGRRCGLESRLFPEARQGRQGHRQSTEACAQVAEVVDERQRDASAAPAGALLRAHLVDHCSPERGVGQKLAVVRAGKYRETYRRVRLEVLLDLRDGHDRVLS